MARDLQSDVECSAGEEGAAFLAGCRRGPTAEAQPAPLSPLPLLLLGAMILIISLLFVNKILEVSSFTEPLKFRPLVACFQYSPLEACLVR